MLNLHQSNQLKSNNITLNIDSEQSLNLSHTKYKLNSQSFRLPQLKNQSTLTCNNDALQSNIINSQLNESNLSINASVEYQMEITSDTPQNISSDTALQSIKDKNLTKIPQQLRDTFINKKQQIAHQKQLRDKIREMETLIKQANERNKKLQIHNNLKKKDVQYVKLQYQEYLQNPSQISKILTSKESVQRFESFSNSNIQSITNLSIPLYSPNKRSNASLLNIQENHNNLSSRFNIGSMNNLSHNMTSNASLRAINMYEYVVAEDLMKELRSAKQKVQLAHQNKGSIENLIEALREENNSLKKTVARYQILAREVNNKQNMSEILKNTEIDPMSRMSPTRQAQSPVVEVLDIKKDHPQLVNQQSLLNNSIDEGRTRNQRFLSNDKLQQANFQISMKINQARSPSEESQSNFLNSNINTSFVRSLHQTQHERNKNHNSSFNASQNRTQIRDPFSIMGVTQFEQLTYQMHFLVRDHQKFFDSILLFIEICKLTLDCDNCVVFVCDSYLEQVYITPQRKDRSYLLRKAYIAGEPYTVILLSENETPDEYLAKVKQDFQDGIMKDTGVLQGSFNSEGKLLFGVQVTKPRAAKADKKSKTIQQSQPKVFNRLDLLKLKFLCEFLAKKAQNLLLKWEAQEKEKKILQILKCCNQIVKQRSHKNIIMTMRRQLPLLFDFEKCCVFLFDPMNEDLFTMAEQDINAKTQDTEADAIIRFPTSIGLTGIHNLKNMIVSEFRAVKQETQKHQDPVGVLQLLNKLGIEPINQFDIDMVNALRIFLGTCVDNITILNYSVKVTLNVGMELNGVSQMINDREERSQDNKMDFDIFMKNIVKMMRSLDILQRPHRIAKKQ
eukprot:403357481